MRLKRQKTEPTGPLVLPAAGDDVILSTTAGGRIPARVTACEQGSFTVAIMVPCKPLSEGQLAALVLDYSDVRGRVRLRGAAVLANPGEHDLLRIENPRSIEILQQREFVRVQTARPVAVTSSQEPLRIDTFTVDISGSGFLLAGPESLKVGHELGFRLSLGEDVLPVTGNGMVVRIDRRGRPAVAIEELSDLERRRLVRFIFDCQRLERRRGLETGGRNGS
ncbi:MAG TPA: PilZ domain-containing protein [Solirubrobacteraceae bacterium]